MNRKDSRWRVIFCLFIIQILLLTACAGKEKATIYDDSGNEIASLNSSEIKNNSLKDEGYRTYVEIVLDEATEVICNMRECTKEGAEQELFSGEYQIHTSFNENVFQSVKNVYDQMEENEQEEGCAITDLNGKILMAYSATGSEDYLNNAAIKRTPYAAFDPLTVYTPAIEDGIINWSTMVEDEELKKSVVESIAESEDTLAIKILEEFGAENSIDFLKYAFHMTLEDEESGLNSEDIDGTVKNIARGYIQEGASPIDMAGYYQIFANGGVYIKPCAIVKICNKNGENVYDNKFEKEQVLKESTADIMNRLLQHATDLEINNVGGKAGQGDGGDWFAGFSPEYSCVIWHGGKDREIVSKDIFSKIIPEISTEKVEEYPECRTVFEAAYCSESGMFISDKCRKISGGYYALDDDTATCNIH